MSVPSLSDRPAHVRLWVALDRLYPLLGRSVTAQLSASGLTTPQFRVLRQLHEQERSPGEIAERIGVTPGNVTGIVDRLEHDGLLTRVRGEDRRYLTLQITLRGTALLEQVVPQMHRYFQDVFSPLSPEETDQMIELLSRIEHHLQQRQQGAQAAQESTPSHEHTLEVTA